jgi:hypothetical protein
LLGDYPGGHSISTAAKDFPLQSLSSQQKKSATITGRAAEAEESGNSVLFVILALRFCK